MLDEQNMTNLLEVKVTSEEINDESCFRNSSSMVKISSFPCEDIQHLDIENVVNNLTTIRKQTSEAIQMLSNVKRLTGESKLTLYPLVILNRPK